MNFKAFAGLKKFVKISFLVIILGLVPAVPPPVWGSSPEKKHGLKYITNYSPKDYNSQSQNWSIIQDKRGVIYLGNQGGVLEFDGVSWKEIIPPNQTVRSLAIDDNGTIYVGGMNEIGYLLPDSKGSLQYVSLIQDLDEEYKNFSAVWRTHWREEGIYFGATKFLFLWNSKEVKVWKTESSFAPPFLCGGKLYIRQEGTGLLEMNSGILELIPGGEEFSDKKIYMMVEFKPGKLLVGTRLNGFYLYDKGKVTPFETDVLKFIINKNLSYGIRLSSGDFALATFLGGVFIIDNRGRLKQVFDKSSGLTDDTVNYVFEDSRGNLWLALDKGAAKIEYASPLSIYNEQTGLPGIVLSVTGHGPNNDLYAGTSNGLYYLEASGKFSPVPGMTGECWFLLSTGGPLLAATNAGVFQVENDMKSPVTAKHSYALLRSRVEPNRTWVGKARGLDSLYWENKTGRWQVERQFEEITHEIRTIVEDKKGNLWLGTRTKGVLKVDFPGAGTIDHPVVRLYNTSHGLPPENIHVFTAAGHIMFTSLKGIFYFDENKKYFLPDHTFGEQFAVGERGNNVFRIVEDKNKNIWMHSEARNIQAIPQPDGSFVLDEKPFLRLPMAQVNDIYPDPGGETTWFAGVDGLIRYDTNVKKNYNLPYQTLIRKVWINEKLVFDGYKSAGKPVTHGPIIPFKDRNLRFEFAAPFFEAESETVYRCLLEGYDNDWTAWKKETWKDYTNLDPGMNTFRVRAKNVYGNVSREDSFQFRILPPWYNTWWAYSLYALAAFLVVFLLVKWRSLKLVREKQKLEQIINERTKEIKEKNRQLQDQSEKLKEMDQVKSRFFANISHEFRTPLTLIMGPLEQMISESPGDEKENKLKMMLRNSQRLLGLINQLLELARFDSGKMKLEVSPRDMVSFLKGIVASFEVLAAQRELELTFHAGVEEVTVYIDAGKMEEVFYNLLANAVKFTPGGGKITVTLTQVPPSPVKEENFPDGYVEISVCDTGPGIPPDRLADIFGRFYQLDGTYEHHRKGTGIGLALAREIVELHGGTVTAHGREDGKGGARFVARLARGKAHLEPGEIVEFSSLPGEPCQPRRLPEEETVEEAENGLLEPYTGEKEIILVVEDSVEMCRYIRGALEPHYKVDEAEDGKKGIEKALQVIPDLIVSDIMMPEVDGYELCRTLKQDRNTCHVPIILLTARASEEDILEGWESGADDYITKPFSTKILCARISNLIDMRRQLQRNHQREMTLRPVKTGMAPLDRDFFQELHQVIESNLDDPDFNVGRLTKKMYMSGATLYRKIRALCGENPTDYIRSYRLKRAAQLLKQGTASVTEVAFEVGFSSRTYFTRCFKEKFHRLPSDFSKGLQESVR
jgi:signal transduction histidine kinase/DNA-binding NarL/FixJ family response regulator/ligand-binding sensor domain-containing protein